jgi:cytochrome P450 family 4
MLAIHQDVQHRLIEEIDEIIGSTDEFEDNELLSNLPYMEMVIKESLRLFPAGGILGRQTTSEMELAGYTIPKGASLVLSVYGMQRSPKFWGDDAHLFRPERFEPENIKNVNPYAYEPFSGEAHWSRFIVSCWFHAKTSHQTGGKRVCIGQKYAMAFMKIFLINFFKAYSVESKLKYDDITLDMIPTLMISQKYRISIKSRK